MEWRGAKVLMVLGLWSLALPVQADDKPLRPQDKPRSADAIVSVDAPPVSSGYAEQHLEDFVHGRSGWLSDAVRQGKLVSLGELIHRIVPERARHIVQVELEVVDHHVVYEFLLIDHDGQLVVDYIDAATGESIGIVTSTSTESDDDDDDDDDEQDHD